jgi:sugar lactone lactonase YvrE
MNVTFESIRFARNPSTQSGNHNGVLLGICLLFAAAEGQAQPLNFTTLAGRAGQGNVDGTATNAQFKSLRAVTIDSSNNVFVADTENHTIRKITPAGIVSTFAGSPGIHGSTDNAGTNALFFRPSGIAVDGSNNVLVADTGNNTIRKITPAGVVSTLAGSAGNHGTNDNSGTNALFFRPSGVAIDNLGNIFVTDSGNNTIRKITAGVVSTFAGAPGVFGSADGSGGGAFFSGPQGIAVDQTRNLYVTDTGNGTIRKITSAGAVTTVAGSPGNFGSINATGTNALFHAPQGIASDAAGNLYVADSGNHVIRKITAAAVVTTVAGSAGNSGSANGQDVTARFWSPVGIAIDGTLNIFVADLGNNLVRKINPTNFVSTLAGSPSIGSADGAGLAARFNFPQGVTVDLATNAYVADTANHTIRKISAAGQVSTFAGSAGNPGSVNNTGTNASFNSPQGAAVDSSGNIFVADTANHVIRKITSGGVVSTFAGSVGISGTADGTNTSAQFNSPQSLVVDDSGNVFVADTLNNLIRKITSAGVVTTIAGSYEFFGSSDGTNTNARFYWPSGIALDGTGNLYVADYLNHVIRKLTPSGTNWVVSTIAGLAGFWGNVDGTNGGARFYGPRGVSVDNSGAIYVSDSGNQTIRKLTASGTNWLASTLGGQAGTAGNVDGAGTGAQFYQPGGLALSSAGILYIADSDNNTIRFDGGGSALITGLVVDPQYHSVLISWNTPVGSTAQVLYGLTPSYGSFSSIDSSLRTSHSFLITGLATNTTYYFQINCGAGTNQFSTAASFVTSGNSLVVDAPHAAFTGIWTIDTAAQNKYSSYYQFTSSTPGSDMADATFRPNILTEGRYDVYIWYPDGTNRSTHVPVLVSSSSGDVTTSVDQTSNGGGWRLLGAGQYFAAGSSGFTQVGNGTGESGKLVVADAMQWVYNLNQDAPTNGSVPGWWAQFYFGTNSVNGSALAANGRTLYENYVIGLDPTAPDSQLHFQVTPLNPGLQLTFGPWQGGRSYQLLSTTNLTNPVWTLVATPAATQHSNGDGVINYTNPTGAKAFYRLLITPIP